MKQGISMGTRQELVNGFASEYAKGAKGQKGVMLDYLCAATGWSRANARRRLATEVRKPSRGVPKPLPRCRPRKYGPAALKLLERIWTLFGEPCGKYLVPIMADELERLERFDEFGSVAGLLTVEVRDELLSMSASTMDRYLKPLRAARYPSALSSTKPGAMLRSEIPVRGF